MREVSIDTRTNGTHFPREFLPSPPSTLDGAGRAAEPRLRLAAPLPPPATDGELVARVLAGDGEAYRPLVERYERAAVGLASRLLGEGGDAEDLAQEAFVRAYRYLRSLKEPERFGPWLFKVVRSLCRDRNRRREAERRALECRRDALRWARVPSGEGVGALLSRLDPEEYQALRLRYYDGLSYEEIARQMKRTFSQVDHLIRKARAHLARCVSRERRCEEAL